MGSGLRWGVVGIRHPLTGPLATALLAAGYSSLFFALWPDVPIADDGAIVVRYLDGFAGGRAFTYNAADGPVFGVSGFVHGGLSGALAYSGLLEPLDSALTSNALGLALTAGIVLLLLVRAGGGLAVALPPWLLVMTACSYLVVNARQGLETPLHLGLVLAALWAVQADRPRWCWPLLALAVISKLDAAPAVLVLGALVLLRQAFGAPVGQRLRALARAAVRGGLAGGLPLLAWLLLAGGLFGNPLPRALLTRFQPLTTTEGARFAFFETGFAFHEPVVIAWVAAAVATAAWGIARRDGWPTATALAPTWACLALLLAYRLAGPTEPMSWYFALPELLMLLQVAGSLAAVIRRTVRSGRLRVGLAALASLALMAVTTPRTLARVRGTVEYLDVVERERIRVGRFVAAGAAPGETLLTGHGHIARESRLHTFDLSGLNSPDVAALLAEGRDPVRVLRPDWIAQHGPLGDEVRIELGYTLLATFDDIAAVTDWPAWTVYQRRREDTGGPTSPRRSPAERGRRSPHRSPAVAGAFRPPASPP